MPITTDPYLFGSGALSTAGVTTTLSNLFKMTAADSTLIDVQVCTLIITNPSGSGQTITSGTLSFSDTVGGVNSSISYALPGTVAIAAGSSQIFEIPLTSGILKNANVAVTFGSVPAAGTLNVLLTFFSGSIWVQGLDPSDDQVSLGVNTTGGATPYTLVSAASTNANSIKASGGKVFLVMAGNTSASPRWLKIFNKASAPTVGTDTPVLNLMIPGNASGSGFVIPVAVGIQLATGIAFAITGGVALLDSTAIGAGDITLNVLYA